MALTALIFSQSAATLMSNDNGMMPRFTLLDEYRNLALKDNRFFFRYSSTLRTFRSELQRYQNSTPVLRVSVRPFHRLRPLLSTPPLSLCIPNINIQTSCVCRVYCVCRVCRVCRVCSVCRVCRGCVSLLLRRRCSRCSFPAPARIRAAAFSSSLTLQSSL